MNVSENVIREIVKQVITESLGGSSSCGDCGFVKKKAPSGVTLIKTDTVKVEPFKQEGVALKDVLTLEEAPRMGAGVMEVDHTSFEWTLTYDEYDVILSGTLEIETNGTVISGGPGDIIYIPKGSHIHFQSPNKVRYAYFVYPANWADLC